MKYPKCSLIAVVAAAAIVASVATPTFATTADCVRRIDKVAGSFAKKRARQVSRCADSSECGSAALEAQLGKLRSRTLRRLLRDCSGTAAGDLGLGATCPDPTGQCAQTLDSAQAVADCVVCMISQTIDPLVRRLRGDRSDDAQTCGGCAATECDPELFCEQRPGHCDNSTAAGICIEPPTACPEIFRPVCGCDGKTYDNNCLRQQARVGLRHPGLCVIRCEGPSGAPCPDGTVCDGLPERCDATLDDGICVPVPEVCPDHIRPVCGCDGVTYANNCERLKAGVRLAHFGECKHECSYDDSGHSDCPNTAFCEQRPGVCREPGSLGICVEIPLVCTDQWDPVCGCDGVTYGNDCERMAAGAGKRHHGECQALCGGIAGIPCNDGEVCELPPHMCDAADLQGHCVPLPDACPQHIEPVCGCDGVTYGNDCERLRAGVPLDHFGPCIEQCTPGGSDCPADQICIALPGHCGDPTAPAACIPNLDVCPLMSVFPVCGCDGVSYPSACEAIAAGVSIDHPGDCP